MPLRNIRHAMDEFGSGRLHSGKGGPVVTSRKQAIAIGLNAGRKADRVKILRKKKGKKKGKAGAMAGMLANRFKAA